MLSTDEQYIQRCLSLAENGLGKVAPNPLVGSVIVKEGKIISEAFHSEYGGLHAEAKAIKQVVNPNNLIGSTLYVNLEPCSHYGKTPPCADLIIKSGIKKVVVGITDPNPLVQGKGFEKLKQAGIALQTNVLQEDCRFINRRFICNQTQKRPYIILKWAQTSDGFIDRIRKPGTCGINWITDEKLRVLVHKWRTEESAIMIGRTTAEVDNPQLTARLWKGKNPVRIILDRNCNLPEHLEVFSADAPTLVFNSHKASTKGHIEYICVDYSKDILPKVFQVLYEKSLSSVIVEGGAMLLQSLIDADLWDEARVFTGTKKFVKGKAAPIINTFFSLEDNLILNDRLTVYYHKKT